MENKDMEKEELITLLSDINVELEKIEAGIQASVNEFWEEWFTQQVSKLTECGEKLEKLEEKLEQIDQIIDAGLPADKNTTVTGQLRLKPGF